MVKGKNDFADVSKTSAAHRSENNFVGPIELIMYALKNMSVNLTPCNVYIPNALRVGNYYINNNNMVWI